LGLNAERLQGDRFAETAEQRIGTKADADGRLGRDADIFSVKRTRAQIPLRRENGPAQDRAVRRTDIDAEFPDGAEIGFQPSVDMLEFAAQVLRRSEYETASAADDAVKQADLDPVLRAGGDWLRKRQGEDCHPCKERARCRSDWMSGGRHVWCPSCWRRMSVT